MSGFLDLITGAFAGIFLLCLGVFVICMFAVNPIIGVISIVIIYLWLTN